MTCCAGSSHSYSYHSAKFVGFEPFESEDKIFFIYHVTTRLMCHVTFWVAFPLLSHYAAKFGVQRSCESGVITFFICHVTTISKCHVTLWVGPLILSYHPSLGP